MVQDTSNRRFRRPEVYIFYILSSWMVHCKIKMENRRMGWKQYSCSKISRTSQCPTQTQSKGQYIYIYRGYLPQYICLIQSKFNIQWKWELTNMQPLSCKYPICGFIYKTESLGLIYWKLNTVGIHYTKFPNQAVWWGIFDHNSNHANND